MQAPSSHTINETCCLQTPCSYRSLRSFLGLYSVFYRFVLNFAQIAGLFIRKLRKYHCFVYTELSEEQPEALNMVKEILIALLELALTHWQGSCPADTDDFHRQIWCVLLQKQHNGNEKPTTYWSCSQTDWMRMWHNSPRMPNHCMGGTVTHAILWWHPAHHLNGSRCYQVDTRPRGCYSKTRAIKSLAVMKGVWSRSLYCIEHQPYGALLRLRAAGEDCIPINDAVSASVVYSPPKDGVKYA